MDKFLGKRKSDDGEGSSSSSNTKVQKIGGPPVTCIVCPGAGGVLGKKMEEKILEVLTAKHNFSLRKLNGIHWNTGKASNASNVALVTAQFPAEGDFFLWGNSFGNRVLCEMVGANQLPARCKGLIICGFPLYGEQNVPDRVRQLQMLAPKSNTQVIKSLLISGTDDEFLTRSFLASKGAALMREQHALLGASSSLVMLEGGKHTVPECKGGKSAIDSSASRVIKEVVAFCTV